ncbi:DUF4287 domain-containing protein [Nocardiopsis aegyptia]|uniref:Uncharacterized protein YndB with AHSA1/START domain n=1 Tax=Nocardiopsis aegyptia TaxID=220378 RepID=A0A7Z0ETZ0_9ACTN|nr:DUF4287 domain-containing protein [Nocardiopsis aegyptia]NYJ38154.1 uncharacterized protein YndB with AHSA1/START domain [Nocardiopsis aegyptia]
MTRQKSFKQRVRARMDKTGESYTAARAHLVGRDGEPPAPDPATAAPAAERPARSGAAIPPTTAAISSRVSDEALLRTTGRGYDQWFDLLDAWGATDRTHTEMAAWLVDEHGVGGWWAQTVTVAYEQARGLRVPGQKKDGFACSASRTVDVPAERVFAAVTEEAERGRWLPDHAFAVRTANAPKRLRADFEGGTRLAFEFTAKGPAKTTVAVEHSRLADADRAAEAKTMWRERLSRLKALLEQGPS